MTPGIILAKVGRRYFRRFPSARNDLFVRGHFRFLCPDIELLSWSNEGFFIYASPRDYISFRIYFFGSYDPRMTDFIKAHVREGAVCWDIGSERGWFSLLFGKLVGPSGQVHSFEPFHPNFSKLMNNIKKNKFDWVIPNNVAISDVNSFTYFVPPSDEITNNLDYLNDCSGVGYLADTARDNSFEVETVTIDDYSERIDLTRLDFMKIDIEGSEMSALKGGSKTISRFRPIIVIEYNQMTARRANYTVEDLDNLLDSFDYDRYTFGDVLRRVRLEDFVNIPEEQFVFNVYCFPRS